MKTLNNIVSVFGMKLLPAKNLYLNFDRFTVKFFDYSNTFNIDRNWMPGKGAFFVFVQ